MKIILFGATGTLGKAVGKELNARHEIVRVGRKRGDFQVDITDPKSIERLYEQTGEFDAVVSTTGDVHFGPLEEFTQDQFEVGLRSKLMGQVNLVTLGLKHIRAGGSFTLTSGQLNDDPIRLGVSGAMVNGALEGFVRSVAIELSRGLRINLVSPTVTEESLPAYGPFFRDKRPCQRPRRRSATQRALRGHRPGVSTALVGPATDARRGFVPAG
jgi:NAD(P)-dependent dehydrogenase (short-subunit alcohol dehydrogenase family)